MMKEDEIETEKRELELEKLRIETKELKEKTEWELKKLKLETTNLNKSFARTLFTSLLTAIVTVCIAVGGWMIQRSSESEARSQADRNHRDEVFAKVLENFGSNNPSTRMSAAVALTTLAKSDKEIKQQAIVALVNRLAIEDDLAVQEQILSAIDSLGEPAFRALVPANRRAQQQLIRDSGQYVGLGLARTSINHSNQSADKQLEATLQDKLTVKLGTVSFPGQREHQLSFASYITMPEFLSRQHKIYEDQKTATRSLIQAKKKEDLDNEIDAALAAVGRSARFLLATSDGLERGLRALSGELQGENLDGIVLLGAHLEGLDLRGISFKRSFLRGNAIGADLSFCDFTYAEEYMLIDKAKLRAATLNDATIYFSEGTDELPDLTGANWWDAYEWDDDKSKEPQTPNWLQEFFPREKQEEERKKLLKEWESKQHYWIMSLQ